MEINIVQKLFLLKRFIHELHDCRRLFNKLNSYEKNKKYINFFEPEKSNIMSFEELKKELLDKSNIMKISNLLKKYYRYYIIDPNVTQKINSRKFLIAWMIVLFPEYTLEIIPNEKQIDIFPHDIYFISKEFIKTLFVTNNNKESIRKFNKIFIQYVNAINYFLMKDKNSLMQKLLNDFIELNKSIEIVKNDNKYVKDLKETYILELVKLKKQIGGQLKKINSGISFDDLEIYSKIYCNVENTVTKNMKRAYYDVLLKDIQEKKFIFFGNTIDEISKYLNILGAVKIDEHFNTKIDKGLLIQKLSHLKIEFKDIVDYGNYIVHIINNLESPISTIDTNMKWEDLIENIDDKYELLTRMLIFFFDEIKQIFNDINNLL
ncbi:hypothetical protein BMW23_0153 [Bodo saltans virus]|uniref:Uncharacterized protein n=1 Tax=Bodo saltans virus TaxID=2024608 RepID=A0A2H4UTF0_9VIRU|nr:hypothetical protein QJ851_gp0149 [Bodo saltans virus]ATZ80212.1 hypothetical protein BMW23_0153 [Bodo saltans virus]